MWHAPGSVKTNVLIVVHVYREENLNGEEIIRIIAAREADSREHRFYLEKALTKRQKPVWTAYRKGRSGETSTIPKFPDCLTSNRRSSSARQETGGGPARCGCI